MTASPAAPPLPAPGALAQGLGFGGLLPFVGLAAAVWLLPPAARPNAVLALAAYAATIVCFLGGIHWGLTMRQAAPAAAALVWGVVPSLVAWAALLMPPRPALVAHALMLLACYGVDRSLYRLQGAQAWLPLRLRLSVVAALSCLAGAAGV